MSFAYDIRNLKDCKDFKNKREDFFKMLRLQAKLNRNYEQATIARQQMEQLGVTPVMQARRSIEDERKDLMLQQQLAIKNLSQIMSDDEVRRTIHVLGDNDIYFLNTEFGRLKPFLEGRANITSDFFKRVLERFKLYLESTGMTGVPIPLRETTLQGMPGDLKDEWDQYARRNVDPETGSPMDIDDLINRTAEAMNRTVEDVKQEVAEEQAMEMEIDTPITEAGVPTPEPETRGTKRKPMMSKKNLMMKKQRTMEDRMMKRKLEEIITGVEEEMAGKRMKPTVPRRFKTTPGPAVDTREKAVKSKRVDTVLKEVLPEKKGKMADSAAIRGVKRKDDQFVNTQAAKLAQTGRLTLEQARSLARSELEQRKAAYVAPPTTMPRPPTPPRSRRSGRAFITPATEPFEPVYVGFQPQSRMGLVEQAREQARQELAARTEARAREVEQGQGLFISPQRTTQEYGPPAVFSRFSHSGGAVCSKNHRMVRRNGKIVGKVGSGIEANDEVKEFSRFRQIGRYMLHVPSLSKSIINIKYPSLVAIPSLPQKFVSQPFIELIWELIDKNVFDKAMFNRLNEDEQDYFRMLASKCQFDMTIGMGMGKAVTKKEKEEYDRFEMLRGTIIAGNNSPEVMNEMRMYILKFLNEKRMPKQQGHDLLYEMACLGVV